MQWTRPDWQGAKTIGLIFLCLAMLSFPFSVAVTNIFLGLTLATGILSGLWWRGIKHIWNHYRLLLIALLAYLVMFPLGLIWSLDVEWGQHIIARHWFWLLLPIVVVVLISEKNRCAFLAAMSTGLIANLVYCVLQANGLVEGHADAGSSMDNPTGHIGHTSFGFIYGIWCAWLVHWGLLRRDRLAWLAWILALWAVVMVFMAQGQSGYMVTVALLLLVAVKWVNVFKRRGLFLTGMLVLFIAGAFIVFGPGKDRIMGTWHALTQAGQQELFVTQDYAKSSAQSRLAWWSMSVDIWRQSPFYGVGTGGFPKAVKTWQADPALQHGYRNAYSQIAIVHPHNQYLITLVRYGLVGLILLLVLISIWVRTGFGKPWAEVQAMPFIALSGMALALHGLDSTSFEEHFSSIFALVLLGVGLSEAELKTPG